MTFLEVLGEIGIQTFAKIVSNLVWFILIYWGVKVIAKEIGNLAKKVPEWLKQYQYTLKEERAINNAKQGLR